MRIIEEFTVARSPRWPNEDRYVVTEDFAAVIDGAGDPLRRSWRGHSIGRHAAETVAAVITSMDPGTSPTEAVTEMTSALRELAVRLAEDGIGPPNPAANMVMYSRQARAIWRVGDCSFRIDGKEYTKPPKAFELTLVRVRQLILSAGLGHDQDLTKLNADVARVHEILHKYQELCQNNHERHAFSFPVLDGHDVAEADIEIYEVGHESHEAVLASDGYPVVSGTLEEAEKTLAEIVTSDPLLIGKYGKAKAPLDGGIAYDDRTYVRIAL